MIVSSPLPQSLRHITFSNISTKDVLFLHVWPGGGGTPYRGLYGEAPPERGAFSRLHYTEGQANLLLK